MTFLSLVRGTWGADETAPYLLHAAKMLQYNHSRV